MLEKIYSKNNYYEHFAYSLPPLIDESLLNESCSSFSMKLESRIIPFEDFFPLSAFEGFTKKIDVNLLMKTKRRKLYMEI